MHTYVLVVCPYFEHDASRYRLALSQHTLIASLKQQTDKNFSIVIAMSPLDPFYSKRLEAFDSIGVPWYLNGEINLEIPRRQILAPDDVFLHPQLVEQLNISSTDTAISYDMSFGYLCYNRIIRHWNPPVPVVSVEQLIGGEIRLLSMDCMWMLPRHQMNTEELRGIVGNVSPTRWPGCNVPVIDRISKARIVTSTAQGCELHPTKSASVIRADRHYVNRGKANRSYDARTRINFGY